jgi:hypothetical protein
VLAALASTASCTSYGPHRSARLGFPAMQWQPSPQEIEDKLIEMAYVWGDIEEELERAVEDIPFDNVTTTRARTAPRVARAFRVEAVYDENGFGDPCSIYELLFDVADHDARVRQRASFKATRLRSANSSATWPVRGTAMTSCKSSWPRPARRFPARSVDVRARRTPSALRRRSKTFPSEHRYPEASSWSNETDTI